MFSTRYSPQITALRRARGLEAEARLRRRRTEDRHKMEMAHVAAMTAAAKAEDDPDAVAKLEAEQEKQLSAFDEATEASAQKEKEAAEEAAELEGAGRQLDLQSQHVAELAEAMGLYGPGSALRAEVEAMAKKFEEEKALYKEEVLERLQGEMAKEKEAMAAAERAKKKKEEEALKCVSSVFSLSRWPPAKCFLSS